MVSNTKQTKSIRRRIRKRGGKRRKRLASREGSTPAFPIHPPGYDPNAPDAKGAGSSNKSSA